MTEENSVPLPGWMRLVVASLALLLGMLSLWLAARTDTAGLPAVAGAALAAVLAVGFLVGALRGRLWKWVWPIPGL